MPSSARFDPDLPDEDDGEEEDDDDDDDDNDEAKRRVPNVKHPAALCAFRDEERGCDAAVLTTSKPKPPDVAAPTNACASLCIRAGPTWDHAKRSDWCIGQHRAARVGGFVRALRCC